MNFIEKVSIIKFTLSEKLQTAKAGAIKENFEKWNEITPSKWILSSVTGASIKIADTGNIQLSNTSREKHLSLTEKALFMIEISRLMKKEMTH